MSEFLPKDEPRLADWFDNRAAKMDGHGAEHGFSATETLQAKDDAMLVRNIVSGGQAIRAYRLKYINFKYLMLFGEKDAATPNYRLFAAPAAPAESVQMAGGIIKRTKIFVRRLRESGRYNEAVGADFRVISPKPVGIAPAVAKPVVKPQVRADSRVAAAFTKNGFDGIELEVPKRHRRGELDIARQILRIARRRCDAARCPERARSKTLPRPLPERQQTGRSVFGHRFRDRQPVACLLV